MKQSVHAKLTTTATTITTTATPTTTATSTRMHPYTITGCHSLQAVRGSSVAAAAVSSRTWSKEVLRAWSQAVGGWVAD
jgi:hypothetical protein